MARIYLANGKKINLDVFEEGSGGSGYVYSDREIKVMPLAAPYESIGYGEVVSVRLQDGRTVETVLQPQEYEHHCAYIDIAALDYAATQRRNPGDVITTPTEDSITAIYEQATGQWREMNDEEYEKERRAWNADMKDMEQIRKEWHEYRHEGDERPDPLAHLHPFNR